MMNSSWNQTLNERRTIQFYSWFIETTLQLTMLPAFFAVKWNYFTTHINTLVTIYSNKIAYDFNWLCVSRDLLWVCGPGPRTSYQPAEHVHVHKLKSWRHILRHQTVNCKSESRLSARIASLSVFSANTFLLLEIIRQIHSDKNENKTCFFDHKQ
jgi:hypothetical protein